MTFLRLILGVCTAICPLVAMGQTQFLTQNWSDPIRQLFYTTSQGSRMLPYDWFLALEVSDGPESFLRTRVPQLGYLPNENTLANPDRLPVGFVADTDWSGKKFIGMNCSACHTNQIRYKDKTYQIDGAPTLADMWGLIAGLRDSLNATAADDAKFGRFAVNVLGSQDSDDNLLRLREEFESFRKYWNQFVTDSAPDATGKLTWGRGRLDAFGMIFNRVSSIDLEIPGNSAPPNAPVSYPFLWGTSWEDRVQWNASAPNRNDIERLGRNVGEVLGVYGVADLQRTTVFHHYYRTSARRLHQVQIENWLKTLWSPAWPSDFPPIDDTKKLAGKVLFDQHCVRCHQVIPHGQQDTPVTVVQTPVVEVGTDGRMALNAITRMAETGRLKGSVLPPDFAPLPAKMPTSALLVNVVHGAIISPFHDVGTNLKDPLSLKAKLANLADGQLELTHQEIQRFLKETQLASEEDLMLKIAGYKKFIDDYNRRLLEFVKQKDRDGVAGVRMESNPYVYKARPLDGIWATAPYLHNGSVANLYELLLPADKRTPVFHVGSTEYDPTKVGFHTESGPGTTEMDTRLDGNRNIGHDQYGNKDFSEEQRLQLLEYLKSL